MTTPPAAAAALARTSAAAALGRTPAARGLGPASAAAALGLLCASQAARADSPRPLFPVEHLEVDGHVQALDAVDLDGDGKLDLVAAVVKGEHEAAQRSLAIFWNHTGTFARRPDLVLPVGPEICAYDFAQLDDRPGSSLLAVTAGGLTARSFTDRALGPGVTVVEQPTFCLGAPRAELRRFRSAQPLGPKGATALLVPSLTALSVYQRSGARLVKRGELPVELETEVRTAGRPAGEQGIARLSVTLDFPAVEVVDANGDGLFDLALEHAGRVRIFLQQKDGGFKSEPDQDHVFKLTGDPDDEDARGGALRLIDVDGDGLVDAVISKTSNKGITSATTRVYLFLGAAGGFRDKPDQVIATDGASFSGVWIADLTGSGHPGLIVPSFKLGVFAIVRMLTSSSLKINFQLHPLAASARRFAEKPSAERELKFQMDLNGKSDNQALDPHGDYDGDGKPDLAFGTAENELSLFAGGQQDSLFSDEPVAKIAVRAYGELQAVDLEGRGRSDLLLHYPHSKGHESEIAVVHNRWPAKAAQTP